MNFVVENQLLLLLIFFALGCAGTGMIFGRPAGSRAWRYADLLWVILGGIGALTAIIAGVYQSDSSQLGRQIYVAYATTAVFDRDAARFRLRYCEGTVDVPTRTLCDRAEFLSASTASNADLPLFISITERTAPLQGLTLGFGRVAVDQMSDMTEDARQFDPAEFLAFTANDDITSAAVDALRTSKPAVAADYQVLATSYETLISQVARLKTEWEFLQANAGILVLQIAALCMVAFAAPFRLGKSIADLRRST